MLAPFSTPKALQLSPPDGPWSSSHQAGPEPPVDPILLLALLLRELLSIHLTPQPNQALHTLSFPTPTSFPLPGMPLTTHLQGPVQGLPGTFPADLAEGCKWPLIPLGRSSLYLRLFHHWWGPMYSFFF